MYPIIAGFLAGAGALYAASELSAKQDEKETGGSFIANDLDINGVKSKLNSYFWLASKLYQRCNDLSLKSCDMMMGSIELPDDDPITKIGNKIYDRMLPVSRAMVLSQLKDINSDCQKLLKKYAGVFKNANETLESHGMKVVLIRKRHVDNSALILDNKLTNENWSSEFEAHLDKVRDFIEESYDAAHTLIDALDSIEGNSSDCTDEELNSICA